MNRVLLLLLSFFAFATFALPLGTWAQDTTSREEQPERICDIVAARDWCDRAMLHRVEGIWEFPEDETTVLIRKAPGGGHKYDIVAVSSPDTRIRAGAVIGHLTESAEADKFEMSLYRQGIEGGILSEPGKCMAQLRDNDNSIVVKGRKVKFSLKTRWLLPSFWKLINLTYKDPLENLPKGLIRVYPSVRRQPDYL